MNRQEFRDMMREKGQYPLQIVAQQYENFLLRQQNDFRQLPKRNVLGKKQCQNPNHECLPLRIHAPISGTPEHLYEVTPKGKLAISEISGHTGIPLTFDRMQHLSYDDAEYIVVGAESCPYFHEAKKQLKGFRVATFGAPDMETFALELLPKVRKKFWKQMSSPSQKKMRNHRSSPLILRVGNTIKYVGGLDQLN
tara:strand:- start:1130 stop:1714 length:585 start_codon:yes stop_codon:yes gene_type:complete